MTRPGTTTVCSQW